MNHVEIRAIRGSLSRAAFARLLGVTTLTVLRWELPEDSKEARRPRAKMIEALRRLAAEGVGHAPASQNGEEADEDVDASEPIAPPTSRPPLVNNGDVGEERYILPLLDELHSESWRRAQDELAARLASDTLRTPAGRALATLGLLQARIPATMDVRGALAALMPILEEVERGALPSVVACRAHVVATMVFSAHDSRVADVGRVNAHAAQALALLTEETSELRILLATSCIAAARHLGREVVLNAFEAHRLAIEGASSPMARLLADAINGLIATLQGDDEASARLIGRSLAVAEAMGVWGLAVGILSEVAYRVLRGSRPADVVLELALRGRAASQSASLGPTESQVRLFAAECEALCRSARLDEALASAEQALLLCKRGGLARYSLTAPLSRLYILSGRVGLLEELLATYEEQSSGPEHTAGRYHAAYLRGLLANLASEYESASQLFEAACAAPLATPGVEFFAREAHAELMSNYLLAGDLASAKRAQQRYEALLDKRPSVWHSALLKSTHALLLVRQGRFMDARQRIDAAAATFQLLGDVVQPALDDETRAKVALATGAPDGEQRAQRALSRISALGLDTALSRRRVEAVAAPVVAGWRELTLVERLVIAVDRLGVKGLDAQAFRSELLATLSFLFPEREVLVGGAELEGMDSSFELETDGQVPLRVALREPIEAEEQAALRLVASFAARHKGPAPALEPELVADSVLPEFIAVAAATRRLKAEILRLSRSSATILIHGESGTGKEVVARAIHDVSLRAQQPYVTFNCASVPRELFEGQLFGHRRGSFTGAVSDSPGVIRAADGGTLFLDEIGELPLEMQPKLLRFLENSEVLPIGEVSARRVDVRVVAATHRDLGRLVREGCFREDLFYRLNVVPLEVPPLRERREDVLTLARLFIRRLVEKGTPPPCLGSDAASALQSHGWPGNVRELRNTIERAMAYSPVPSVLAAEHFRLAQR